MKRSLVLIALSVCLPALAEEPKNWPQKGDTVFVAGELTGVISVPLLVPTVQFTTPACTPIRVSFSPKPTKLMLEDTARQGVYPLCEGWGAWVYQTAEKCSAAPRLLFQKRKGCYLPG